MHVCVYVCTSECVHVRVCAHAPNQTKNQNIVKERKKGKIFLSWINSLFSFFPLSL